MTGVTSGWTMGFTDSIMDEITLRFQKRWGEGRPSRERECTQAKISPVQVHDLNSLGINGRKDRGGWWSEHQLRSLNC